MVSKFISTFLYPESFTLNFELNLPLIRVVTLCMSPIDDTFLSGSLDKTIRLWDLRSPNCQVNWIYLKHIFVVKLQVHIMIN